MRSLLSVLVVAGCGRDIDVACTSSTLTYETFGQPFMLDWCTGCHSDALPPGQRQSAPVYLNFDTLDQVRAWSTQIQIRAGPTEPTMPPAGGPSVAEREMLAEWLHCGAPQ